MKKIAAITMARNDNFFLSRWIEYYGRELGRENLYVILDGFDQPFIPEYAGVNIVQLEHQDLSRTAFDKLKSARVSDMAHDLFKHGYDLVIGCDSDEFLIADAALGLGEYLSQLKIKTSVSGLGLDIGQNTRTEKTLVKSKPFLAQREYATLNTRYTKPIVIARPVRWGRGFHSVKKHNFHIDKNLYILHMGSVDLEMMRAKAAGRSAVWIKHLNRQIDRTIGLISRKRARSWKWVKIARFLQTIFRPPYAWNKPGMLGIKPVVRLPKRFKSISV